MRGAKRLLVRADGAQRSDSENSIARYLRIPCDSIISSRAVFTPANKGCRLSMAADPNRRPHGRVVRGSGGYTAFVPAPLPPSLTWDGELVAALSNADRAIGPPGRRGPGGFPIPKSSSSPSFGGKPFCQAGSRVRSTEWKRLTVCLRNGSKRWLAFNPGGPQKSFVCLSETRSGRRPASPKNWGWHTRRPAGPLSASKRLESFHRLGCRSVIGSIARDKCSISCKLRRLIRNPRSECCPTL